jgi:hypothetical protein
MSLTWNGKKYEVGVDLAAPGTQDRTEYYELMQRADDYEREQRMQRLSDSQPLPLGAKLRYMAAALLVSLGLWALIAWGCVAAYRAVRAIWG